jgi:hypothetical protein
LSTHAAAVSVVPGPYSPGEHYDATHYHGGYAYRGGYGYHGGCGYRPYGYGGTAAIGTAVAAPPCWINRYGTQVCN